MPENDPMKEPMLAKFRRKLVVTNMVFATLVLLVVGITAASMNYGQQERKVYDALDRAVAMDNVEFSGTLGGSADEPAAPDAPAAPESVGKVPGNPGQSPANSGESTSGEGGPPNEDSRRSSTDDVFVATSVYNIAADGTVTEVNDSLSLDDATLESALSIAAENARSGSAHAEGDKIASLDLYYKAETTKGGTVKVALASGNYVRQSVVSLFSSFTLPFVAALVGFFFISVLLSRWSVRPVAKAWQQQQQFVADASHELKTPLSVIMANNSILASDPEATVASQMQWVESTQTEASLMQGLVNDMLYLAQTDSETRGEVLSEVDFSEIVQGGALQFESVAFERGVVLEENIQQGIRVHGDPAQLQRLVGTLVDNACKYAEGGGRVGVNLQLCGPGSKCRLIVSNTGAPIDPEDLPHLFDRFYRSDKARTRGSGGFGLGLSIAKGIVDSMDGTIEATSSEKGGTCFTVVLRTV